MLNQNSLFVVSQCILNYMINRIEQTLKTYSAWRLGDDIARRDEAAVLMLITDEEHPHVILTRRTSGLSSHAGEVAFPGGKRDPEDPNLIATALRETEEEIGISGSEIRILGSLSDILSKHKLRVEPWVGLVSPQVNLIPNPDEIESVFRVPISFLMEPGSARFDQFQGFDGKTRYAPAWDYQGYDIWGLTAWVLAELLNAAFDAKIKTRPRPERVSDGES